MKTILYIHGMGGGADSRIPSVLNGWFRKHRRDIRVVVRTYDFHPDRAAEQIRAWYEELQPALVIGESLGANHALALQPRVPLLLVSPAIQSLVNERKPTQFIKEQAMKEGMVTMRQDGIKQILDGITTSKEVLQYTM